MIQNRDNRKTDEAEIRLRMFELDDKISYNDYQNEIRPVLPQNIFKNKSRDDTWVHESRSELLEDLPTNETYTTSEENENNDEQAIKFLTENGILKYLDPRMRFLRSNKDDQSYLGDIDVKSVDKVVEYKFRDIKFSNFSILEDPFEDESFNPADTLQEQLQKNPLPDFWILNSDVGEAIRVDRDCEDSDIEIFPEKRIIEDLELHTVLEKTNSGNSNLVEHIEPPKIEETKVSKVEKRKLTEFNYLLQRKGLRLMRKYYKDQFENFAQNYDYKKRVKKMLPNELNHIMSEYAQKEFWSILPVLTVEQFGDTVAGLTRVALSDRANKKELMTQGIDFNPVKNLLAKYTKSKMKAFLKDPINSFLYTHFYLINGKNSCYEQDDVDQDNFNTQMKKLLEESSNNLSLQIKSIYSELLEDHRNPF